MKGMNIMKKTRLFSKIAAMALVVVMVCCVGASAYGAATSILRGAEASDTADVTVSLMQYK